MIFLTRSRHDKQPLQVLPMDAADSLDHIRIRRTCTSALRDCGLLYRRECNLGPRYSLFIIRLLIRCRVRGNTIYERSEGATISGSFRPEADWRKTSQAVHKSGRQTPTGNLSHQERINSLQKCQHQCEKAPSRFVIKFQGSISFPWIS